MSTSNNNNNGNSNNTPTSITPASLFSLAIFNPSLGPTDETLPDQIVFWTSRVALSQNDRLRQIGLAQGVVEFARGFSNRQDLSTVETQKSRIILHQIEPGWWILAYIDLTQIHYAGDTPTVEYSPREVAPPSVLLAQLITSYNQFTFFNGTLDHVLHTHDRLGLAARLDRFYTRWAWRWEVMLSGNPASDVWGGIRIGRGVGAEEKEVLRGFIERNAKSKGSGNTVGLVDMVVSRFGEPAETSDKSTEEVFSKTGTGKLPRPGDGCIFRGAGNISARSVRDVTHWMSDWARLGDDTFLFTGRSIRRKKKQKKKPNTNASDNRDPVERIRSPRPQRPSANDAPKPPPPPASEDPNPGDTGGSSLLAASNIPPRLPMQLTADPAPSSSSTADAPGESNKAADSETTDGNGDGNKVSNAGKIVMDIFTFGTYSAWNRTRSTPVPSKPSTPEPFAEGAQEPEEPTSQGRFVIGYTGDIENEDEQELAQEDGSAGPPPAAKYSTLITRRAVWVERTDTAPEEVIEATDEASGGDISGRNLEQCTLVVYINHPFIFALIFDTADPNLDLPSYYRTLHYQLGPLREPLLASAKRQPGFQPSKGVFDLIFDPDGLTVHTSIPNIPEPRVAKAIGGDRDLPRIEALHVHTQVVRIYEDTRWAGLEGEPAPNERERTNRTIRGWWIGWMKLEGIEVFPHVRSRSIPDQSEDTNEHVVMERSASQQSSQSHLSLPMMESRSAGRREAFIIRKGTEHIRSHSRNSSSKEKMVPVTSGKLADGIGIDTKRYFEQLLNFAART